MTQNFPEKSNSFFPSSAISFPPEKTLVAQYRGPVLLIQNQNSKKSEIFEIGKKITHPLETAQRFGNIATLPGSVFTVGDISKAGCLFRYISKCEAFGYFETWIMDTVWM